ncbi:secretion protein HlyD [Calothrix sp. NIES-4071]|nr:secretion protein HlyD [Calothrix sp. NIES-4071]BAZ59092.1 secretion protein HlyD [Calothrix sp. NIES-4105]
MSELLPQFDSDDFLPPINRWTILGGLFLVGSIGLAFIVASFTKYNITVKAKAIVRPSGEVRIVQASFEGTVNSIEVRENQVVKRGDSIAIIDSSQLRTKKSQLFENIQQYKLQLVQIDAQLRVLQSQIIAESNSTQRAIAQARADLKRNEREYKDKQIISQSELIEAQASVELAREQLRRYQELANTGAIATLQIQEKLQAFRAAEARFKRTKALINPVRANITIATERISQEQAKAESAIAQLNKERIQLIQRRVEIQGQIGNAQKEQQQILTELQKAVITSPESGTVLKLELRNSGQVVRTGDIIAQIVPSQAPLVMKARVSSDDISKVQVCKIKQVTQCKAGKVQMRISAYPYPDYGILNGAVRTITADIITKELDSSAPAPYYELTIEPEKLFLQRYNQQYPIQTGMEATADIISQQETVLQFILRKARLIGDI